MDRNVTILVLVLVCVFLPGCTGPQPPDTEQATGSLEINSTPGGSEAFLDGILMGRTPLTVVDVPGGTHTFELRYRDHTSFVRTLNIRAGTRSYIDATLSPLATKTVPVIPATTTNRGKPARSPAITPGKTMVPASDPAAGCWRMEQTVENVVLISTLILGPDGTGWMNASRITPSASDSVTDRIRWSADPNSTLVTLAEANPPDPQDPDLWFVTYDRNADILDAGDNGDMLLHYRRVACTAP